MRSNYFTKLLKYMKEVYSIERGITKLSDGRVYPKYKTSQVILPVLLGFMLRIKSIRVGLIWYSTLHRIQTSEYIDLICRVG